MQFHVKIYTIGMVSAIFSFFDFLIPFNIFQYFQIFTDFEIFTFGTGPALLDRPEPGPLGTGSDWPLAVSCKRAAVTWLARRREGQAQWTDLDMECV